MQRSRKRYMRCQCLARINWCYFGCARTDTFEHLSVRAEVLPLSNDRSIRPADRCSDEAGTWCHQTVNLMTLFIVVLSACLLMLTSIVGVREMLLAIMLVRPSCDRVFDWLKLTFDDPSGPGASINAVIVAMGVVTLFNTPQVALSGPVLAWAAFLASAAGSLIYAPDPDGGLRIALSLTTYAAAFILPYAAIRSRRDFAQCLNIALWSSLVPSAVALVQIVGQAGLWTGDERLQSTFTHPNIFAFYLAGVITLILYMNCSARLALSSSTRRAMFVYIGYLLLLLLLTKTRSAWVSIAFILVGYSVLVDRRWFLPILSLPVTLLIPGISDRLTDLESGTIAAGFEQLNSLAWRELLWKETIEWLRSNPAGFLGHGLGSYQSYVPDFFPRGGDVAVGPHNALLQIYFETGVAGLLAFTLLISVIAYKLFAATRRDFAGSVTMLMMCAGYVLVFYYDNLLDYLQFQWFFWFLLGTSF